MTHKFQSWGSVALGTMSDRISRKMVTGEKAMVAQLFLKQGAEALETLVRAVECYARGDKRPSSSNVSFHHERPSKGAKQP
jgi:hypothetical protein